MSEFAKQLFRFFVVCARCFLGGSESTESIGFAFTPYGRLPKSSAPIKIGTLVSALIGSARNAIRAIVRMCGSAQICSAVIKTVLIPMVNFLSWLGFHNQPVHENWIFAESRMSDRIESSSLFAFPCHPIPLCEPFIIKSINQNIFALREGNQAVGLIKRLFDRVSSHAAFHRCTSNALLKISLYFTLLCLSAAPAFSQVAPMSFVRIQWFDNTGKPCAACLLFTYVAGSSVPQTTYSDALGTIPNADPVVADSAGRMNVFVGTSAFKFILTTATMVQLWSEDNITNSSLSLLSTNNTWAGTQTFSAATTFNATPTFTTGFTAAGPVNLGLGGSLAGTFSGSPTFSGTPNFSGGIVLASLSLSGQLTSTVSTGTAPFVIASTTNVPNLNASLLLGSTWASPGAIGSTTPAAGTFTALIANTSFALNGSSTLTGVQGTDTKLVSSGTVSGGAGTSVCLDGNAGLTTSGCAAGHSISLGTNSSVCSTTNSAGATCSTAVTITPSQPDTLYIANCTGVTPTQYPFIIGVAKGLNTITVTISNGSAGQAQISTFAELDCSAIHP